MQELQRNWKKVNMQKFIVIVIVYNIYYTIISQ